MHRPAITVQDFAITIAGITIEVSGTPGPAALGIAEQLAPFLVAPVNPVARIALRWETSPSLIAPAGRLLFDPGSIWKMYLANGEYFATIAYNAGENAEGPQAVLRANSIWDDLTLTERRDDAPWRSQLGLGAGELILRAKLVLTDGLVLHAAGIDDNGRGIVFVGHSGAGKSTHASLWSGVEGTVALSDDRVAVRACSSQVTCYGTPWGGTANIARNHEAPLSAIVVLEQGAVNEIQLLSPSAAASLLLARAFLPLWDRELMQRALANTWSILARVPVYRLRCTPERMAVQLVRSVL